MMKKIYICMCVCVCVSVYVNELILSFLSLRLVFVYHGYTKADFVLW